MTSINLFKSTTKETFLRDYWQKKPRVFKAAMSLEDELISGNELAYLACDPQIESRFVFCDSQETEWTMESGPFQEERFNDLPTSPYTLMVQSVDQWVPELHEVLHQFDFLPKWRLDDMLATYATTGGGVGPHFDYYDVFLIQASGQRRWRIGQACNQQTPLRDNPGLKLLKDFEQHGEFVLDAGDILYIPAGIAHWGTSLSDDCTTLSVGFRAPSQAELLEAVIEPLITQASEDNRFTDSVESLAVSNSGHINSAVIDRAIAIIQSTPQEQLREAVAGAFAQLVTEPRNLDIIDPEEDSDAVDVIRNCMSNQEPLLIELDAACRAAYLDNGEGKASLYLNGIPVDCSLAFAEGFCAGRIEASLLDDSDQYEIIKQWATLGYIYVSFDPIF